MSEHDYTLQFDWDDIGAIYVTVDDFVEERIEMSWKTKLAFKAFMKALAEDMERMADDD